MQSKRITDPSPSCGASSWTVQHGSIEADFEELIIGSVCEQVPLASSIPFVSLTDYTRSGILRRLHLLHLESTTGTENGDTYHNGGISLASNTLFVGVLTGVLSCEILAHFKGLGTSDKDTLDRMVSRSEWYGTVDEMYHLSNDAI